MGQGGSVSDDGRFITFFVYELHPPVVNASVWLRDEWKGTTSRVDLSSTGVPGNGHAMGGDLSADGRFVVFTSTATNFVSGPANDLEDVYWRDLELGLTLPVSEKPLGVLSNGPSFSPVVSEDGRVVAFYSAASNFVRGDTNGCEDVFAYDVPTGSLSRVSVSSSGEQGNSASWNCTLSGDGRFVAFSSNASNLAANDSNLDFDVFVHDRATGQTTLISRDPSGGTSAGSAWIGDISRDGRFVTFTSSCARLVPGDTNGVWDAFLHDRSTASTVRVSVDPQGNQLERESYAGPLSADNSQMLITSAAGNLVPGDTNGEYDVFRVDLATGALEWISLNSSGLQALTGGCMASDLSGDGRFAVFGGSGYSLPYQPSGVYLRACPQSVARFGAAKENSAGCRPWISWTGVPSATAGAGLIVRSQGQLNHVPGLFFYGYAPHPWPTTLPYLLVMPPLHRLPVLDSGGSASGIDCTGGFRVDFNAWIAAGGDPALVAGATVYGQFWSRDPGFAPPDNYGLTDAVDLTIQP